MTTQFSVYRDQDAAQAAVHALEKAGVSTSQISVFLSETAYNLVPKVRPAVPEGAVVGGTLGAVLAGIGGATALLLPGVGIFAAGPLALALEAVLIGSVSGGFVGALAGIGVPENQAKQYAKALMEHGVVVAVSVNTPHEARLVEETFEQTRGVNLVRVQRPDQSVAVEL